MSSTAPIVNWSISSSVTGDKPGPGDARDRPAGGLERGEERDERRAWRRQRAKPEDRLGDHREGALRPDDEVGQRVARHVLDVLAAGPQHRAVGHHHFEPEHRLARLAVLDAAQAASVCSEVPADRADLEAGRIGRVEQAFGRHGLFQCGVDDPRLGDDDEVVSVDLEDLVHCGERDRERALDPRRAARQAGTRTARDDRDPELPAEADELGDLARLSRQGDRTRQPGLEVRRLVAPVALTVDCVGQEPQLREPIADRADEGIGHRGNLGHTDQSRTGSEARTR